MSYRTVCAGRDWESTARHIGYFFNICEVRDISADAAIMDIAAPAPHRRLFSRREGSRMKTRYLASALVIALLLAACGQVTPAGPATTAPLAAPTIAPTGQAPLANSPVPSADPTPTWTTGDKGVNWAQIDFQILTPPGVNLQQSWNALGMDDQGRIYIGFTSTRNDGRDDFAVFRYDPAGGKKDFLGTFIDIAQAAGNYQEGESIPKGHTRMIFADGKMYMASQGFHDLKQSIDSLPTYRGSHLFAYDINSGTWQDLAAALPGGVVTVHEGLISLNLLSQAHLLIGLAHPSSNIVLFNYETNQLVRIVPGIPWKLGNPLSREVIVAPSGNIYTYRGTEPVSQRHETHSVWVYNLHSGAMKDTGFQMTNGFWIGQTQKRDGSKIYLNTTGGEMYEFDVATETFKDLGYELPKTDNRTIDYTYTITLSPDEKRIYYILSVIQNPGGQEGDGSGGSGELYYYDIATGQVVFVQQLPVGIYTSQDLRDAENIYFSHFGSASNLWSNRPGLFILHVPPQP